jgi:hypothetical protein
VPSNPTLSTPCEQKFELADDPPAIPQSSSVPATQVGSIVTGNSRSGAATQSRSALTTSA